MSGSVMYTSVDVSAARAARQRARRAEQAAERRRREAARAAERQRHAEARAAARARAAAERRRHAEGRAAARAGADAERARRRAADESRRATAERAARQRAAGERLAEVNALIERLPQRATPGRAAAARTAAELADRLPAAPAGGLDAEIEALRQRVARLGEAARQGERADDRRRELAALWARLTPAGERADPAGHRAAGEALERLRAALDAGETVRFEALAGTAAHLLDRHDLAIADAAEARAARERAAAEARAAADREAAAEARAAEERARLAAERAAELAEREAERLAELAERRQEAADRLAVVRDGVLEAVRDATDFADEALADELRAALGRAEGALAGAAVEPALAAVAAVEELLPRAEARLDELLLALERRAQLARALQDAMSGHGFTLTEGNEASDRLVMRFERLNGAVYDAAIRTDGDGQARLTYEIDGEPGIPEGPNPVAGCATEDLLDDVHAALAAADFVAGELDWDGKPPRRGGPGGAGAEARRRR
ncbi:hypothetical protein RM844_14565 [Streptomyces sp. DSM 44915]|uniref:TolA protein n=1 Tax=Streptomyces chisholmiae TaxID=3075540 RepID=A0ABU2JRA6_9ACTN|nr:hypothetical protein [Streptomyces sp. DSM 44915]MDT0267510.1 hypothetical protein [Streptomyces sp. DSM 44915]